MKNQSSMNIMSKRNSIIIIFLVLLTGTAFYYSSKNINDEIPSKAKIEDNKISYIFYTKDGDIFSITPDKSLTTNLSKKLNPEGLVSSSKGNRIAYRVESTSQHAIYVADGDGSDATQIFTTPNTGCDIVGILGVENDNKNVLFMYLNMTNRDGIPCISKPGQKTEDGNYYYENGVGLKRLKDDFSQNLMSFDNGKLLYVTYGKDKELLYATYDKDKEWLVTINIFDLKTEKTKSLFTLPPEIQNQHLSLSSSDLSAKNFKMALSLANSSTKDTSQITIFDSSNNTYTPASPQGVFAEFQRLSVSPNFKNLIYVHQVRNNEEQYVYNVQNKKIQDLNMDLGNIIWLDDYNLLYRYPVIKSWPVKDHGNLIKFNIENFKREVFLETISELVNFNKASIPYGP